MIPGVEILDTNRYVMDRTWGWDWVACFFATLAILAIILIIIAIKDKAWGMAISLLLPVIICGLSSLIGFHDTPVYGIEYQCTISEDVSLTDVYNNYTIESVNGKIYTLRPIEPIPFVEGKE